jgi:hypothetical protein
MFARFLITGTEIKFMIEPSAVSHAIAQRFRTLLAALLLISVATVLAPRSHGQSPEDLQIFEYSLTDLQAVFQGSTTPATITPGLPGQWGITFPGYIDVDPVPHAWYSAAYDFQTPLFNQVRGYDLYGEGVSVLVFSLDIGFATNGAVSNGSRVPGGIDNSTGTIFDVQFFDMRGSAAVPEMSTTCFFSLSLVTFVVARCIHARAAFWIAPRRSRKVTAAPRRYFPATSVSA